MNGEGLGSRVWLTIAGMPLHESVLLSLALTLLLSGLAAWLGTRLSARPGRIQMAAEVMVVLMRDAVAEVVPGAAVPRVLPFIGTLWVFILSANLLGLVPGLSAPTRDISVTGALACLVFLAVHGYGVREAGWRAYLRHYLEPSPILLPFHLISEFTRTLALAVRLFGNMMSLEMAALLVLLVAGFLVPVPLLLLHVVEALVQAYIFGMLALIYIGSAIEVRGDATPPSSTEKEQ
ncbi:F0F1 ATP synthase subunit A [Cupriavidus campinensis]